MWKWRSKTPHEDFRMKYAENEAICGNLRYSCNLKKLDIDPLGKATCQIW